MNRTQHLAMLEAMKIDKKNLLKYQQIYKYAYLLSDGVFKIVFAEEKDHTLLISLVNAMLDLHDGDAIYRKVSTLCNTLILTDGARQIRVFSPQGCQTFPVDKIPTVSTVGAGDNFNAGYIYAMLRGIADQPSRIAMAQRWSQDVCQQLGNNISDELARELNG